MGLIKGQASFKRWKLGKKLKRQESIDAHCYECNGGEKIYCGGEISCALYLYSPFSREAIKKRGEDGGKGSLQIISDHKKAG